MYCKLYYIVLFRHFIKLSRDAIVPFLIVSEKRWLATIVIGEQEPW